jgi:hypothetical protein
MPADGANLAIETPDAPMPVGARRRIGGFAKARLRQAADRQRLASRTRDLLREVEALLVATPPR